MTVVCIEKGDVWRGLESIIHRAFYTPLLSLSLSLSFPTLALYTISPFHLGALSNCRANSILCSRSHFDFRRGEAVAAERKGKERSAPTAPTAEANRSTRFMHPHCGYGFEDN